MRQHARTVFLVASILTLALVAQAAAQHTTLGASLGYGGHDTTKPHAQLDVTVAMDTQNLTTELPEGGQLGVRLDVTAPFNAVSYPALGASVVWRQPSGSFTPYAGIGADVRWFDLDGTRCYETAGRLLVGTEWSLTDAWSLRAEGTALTSGRLAASIGIALSLP